ncbi:MAG: EamA family transporter [Pirellulaceae bacterium]
MNKPVLSPQAIGMLGGAASSIFYTITNVCLREINDVEPVLVQTVKAIPTLLIVLPMVFLQSQATGQSASNSNGVGQDGYNKLDYLLLVVISFAVQIFGNVGFQVALSILGLTISVPIVLATMLIGGAITGKYCLNESVSSRRWVAVFVLILATVVLSFGARSAQDVEPEGRNSVSAVVALPPVITDAPDNFIDTGLPQSETGFENKLGDKSDEPGIPLLTILFGLAANIGSGVAYAIQSTIMRRSMQRGMSAAGTLTVISGSGILFLTIWSFVTLGADVTNVASSREFSIMAIAGVFNALAFFSMAKSLQHVSVLFVQLLNASQAGISAAAGWWLFDESMNREIIAGLVLTTVGLVIAGTRDSTVKAPTPLSEEDAGNEDTIESRA